MIVALARWVSRLGAVGVLGVVAPMTAYLVMLVAGAARETFRRRPAPPAARHLRFAVLPSVVVVVEPPGDRLSAEEGDEEDDQDDRQSVVAKELGHSAETLGE